MKYKGIIFDCDGVIVDSEGIHAQVFSGVLSEHGFTYSKEQCLTLFHGLSLSDCFAKIVTLTGYSPDAGFVAALTRQTQKEYETGLKPVEGIQALLEDARLKNIVMAVASNGKGPRVVKNMDDFGFSHYFDSRIFGSDHVNKPKPAPDLYHLAAQSMGCPAQKICVVEDSVTGVQAAVSAGLSVFWYTRSEITSLTPALTEMGNVQVVRSLSDICAFI